MPQCETYNYAGERQTRVAVVHFNPTYSKKSMPQGEVAVNVGNVDSKVSAPRNTARAQVNPVVDDGQHRLFYFLLQVPDHYLRGRQQSRK